MLDDRSYIDLDVVMIMILWGNVLTFVKYVLKYSDGILMFEDYFQICVFRCICVCVLYTFILTNDFREYIQFSSVAQLCLTLFDPMNRSTPGLPVHHQLLEFTQTQVH